MKSASSQVHVVMWISVKESQEIDVITFFLKEENPKLIISEKNQHIL